ncbi:MAG: hypothetical protein U5K99_07025 [Anaerolineales bacterium]|nr:hypothetical protein [Anaerolineales bacterium]
MKSYSWILILVGLMMSGAISGCGGGQREGVLTAKETAEKADIWETEPSPTPEPTITAVLQSSPTPSLTPTPTITPVPIYPPEPREITFQAEDGQELAGMYFPAGIPDAPVLVLMHWSRGDQAEWEQIAAWIQNRGLAYEQDFNKTWKMPAWFPDYPPDLEIAVFTFTFRGCEGGCRGYPAGEWLLDARAGITAAANLPGVDGQQILAAGASIGADGAVDACVWLNNQGDEEARCRGAFALSPGSFLTVPYEQAAGDLLGDDPPAKLYCLYARRDDAAVETCQSVPGAEVIDYGYVAEHGMQSDSTGIGP